MILVGPCIFRVGMSGGRRHFGTEAQKAQSMSSTGSVQNDIYSIGSGRLGGLQEIGISTSSTTNLEVF